MRGLVVLIDKLIQSLRRSDILDAERSHTGVASVWGPMTMIPWMLLLLFLIMVPCSSP